MVVHDEETEEEPLTYFLSEKTRNKIIYNGRQDAAHAVLNTITIIRKVNLVNRLLMNLIAMVAVLICGVFHIRPW